LNTGFISILGLRTSVSVFLEQETSLYQQK